MKIWYISGKGLDTIEVIANSFDEALSKAREINKNYDGGQIKEG